MFTRRGFILAIVLFAVIAILFSAVKVGVLVSYVQSRLMDGGNVVVNNVSVDLGFRWWVVDRDDPLDLQLGYLRSMTGDDVMFVFIKSKSISKQELLSDEWEVRGAGVLRNERVAVEDIRMGGNSFIEAKYASKSDIKFSSGNSVLWSSPDLGIIVTINEASDESVEVVKGFLATAIRLDEQ